MSRPARAGSRTYGQAAGALAVTDGEQARVLHRSAAQLLGQPLSRSTLESLLAAVA